MKRYLNCARLNLRMLRHIFGNRWLGKHDFAASYDRLATDYDRNWLVNLKPVTDKLLAALPENCTGTILDLGAGTGYTTAVLEKKYPEAKITAVDISQGMLDEAQKICNRSKLVCADLLDFLREQPDDSAELIVSGWAIGYSVPEKVTRECSRILKPGGTFAFVVNYADTLEPVFYAFRRCMAAHPEKIRKALWPKFPKDQSSVEKMLISNDLRPQLIDEDKIPINPPESTKKKLPWLLKTGVIAGFDTVLPLLDDQLLAEQFELELEHCGKPIEHHYIAVLAQASAPESLRGQIEPLDHRESIC